MTYSELDKVTNRLARGLVDHHIQRGDCVAIVASNCVEHVLLQHAVAKIGAVLAAVNWRQATEELRYAINLVEPQLLVLQDQHRIAVGSLEGLPPTVCIDDAGSGELWAKLIEPYSDEYPEAVVYPEDIVTILYTSGSTGRPKAAAISHRAFIARAALAAAEMRLTSDDGHLAWAPTYHLVSADYVFITVLLGSRFIVVPGFDVETINHYLHHEQLGWLVVMPGTFDALIDRVRADERPVRPIRLVGAMADLVPPAKIVELTEVLGAPYFNSYGCTESGPITGSLIGIGDQSRHLGKRLSALVDTRIVDLAKNDVSDGEVGELWLRGPTLFSRYWKDEPGTAEAVADGWYHSGDLMKRDTDGLVHFVSRSKYLIKSGGENIYPAEIERVLLAHPEVAEAAVVGRPDDIWGEVPVAFVAICSAIDVEGLKQYCRQHLAGYKIPKVVIELTLEDFPRNVTGKIIREELESLANVDGHAESISP